MRHRNGGWKLQRNTSHRRALLRNLVTSLIVEGTRIETTVIKAKAMRPHVERMISLGKRGDVAARRLAAAYLMTSEAVDKLFADVAPRYGDRQGGYTRILRTGFRRGDGGERAIIELVGTEAIQDEKRAKRAEARAKRAEEMRKQMEEQQQTAGGGEEQ